MLLLDLGEELEEELLELGEELELQSLLDFGEELQKELLELDSGYDPEDELLDLKLELFISVKYSCSSVKLPELLSGALMYKDLKLSTSACNLLFELYYYS